jgi:6-phosphogluconolactonase
MPALWRAFPARDALMAAAAEGIERCARAAIVSRGAANIALSGGSTPRPAYEALARADLPWKKVRFLLVDERFVPLTSDASNERMLRDALAPALAAGATLLPMYADGASLEEAAARADTAYAPLRIDAALMGMGGDGHTASWFPRAPRLAEALDPSTTRTVVSQIAPGAQGSSERLTLTLPAIAHAGAALLLITGEDKRAVLERALAENDAPVAALFDRGAPVEVLWAA